MNKSLHKNDTYTTPFQSTKDWELSNVLNQDVILTEAGNPVALEFVSYKPTFAQLSRDCNLALEQQDADKAKYKQGLKTTGLFYPDTDPINTDGTYKRIVYSQIKTMFYNNYRDPTKIWGTEKIDFDKSEMKRFITDKLNVFDIPTVVFGEKILENSVVMFDMTLDNNYTIVDDGNGNLFAEKNLFSRQQEIGIFVNIFVSGSDPTCGGYFNFNPPDAPTELTASSGSVLLDWKRNSNNEDGFVVEKSQDTGSTWSVIKTTSPAVTHSVDTNIVKDILYSYRVYAFNSFGTSSYTNTASIIISDFVSINDLSSSIDVTSSFVGVTSSLLSVTSSLRWTPPFRDHVYLYRSNFSGGAIPPFTFLTELSNSASFYSESMAFGTQSYYKLQVTNSISSAFSNTVSSIYQGVSETWTEYNTGSIVSLSGITNLNSGSGNWAGSWKVDTFLRLVASESFFNYVTRSYLMGDTSLSGGYGLSASWLITSSYATLTFSESFNEYSTKSYNVGDTSLSGGNGMFGHAGYWDIQQGEHSAVEQFDEYPAGTYTAGNTNLSGGFGFITSSYWTIK